MVPFERTMVVSYRLSITTITLTTRGRNSPSNISDAQTNGVSHFRAKFGEEG